MEQVTRPGDASRYSWQVTHNWWLALRLLILIFDMVDLKAIVVEQDVVLGVKTILEIVSVQDGLELSEKLERVLNAGDDLEVLVDVALEIGLD